MNQELGNFLQGIQALQSQDTQERRNAEGFIQNLQANDPVQYIQLMTSLFEPKLVAHLLPVKVGPGSYESNNNYTLNPRILFLASSDLWAFVKNIWSASPPVVKTEQRLKLMNTLLELTCASVAIQHIDLPLFNKLALIVGILVLQDGTVNTFTQDFVQCIDNANEPSIQGSQNGVKNAPLGTMRVQALNVLSEALAALAPRRKRFKPVCQALVEKTFSWLGAATQPSGNNGGVDFKLYRACVRVQARICCMSGIFHQPTVEGCVKIFPGVWFQQLEAFVNNLPQSERYDPTAASSDKGGSGGEDLENETCTVVTACRVTLRLLLDLVLHFPTEVENQLDQSFYAELFPVLLRFIAQPPSEECAVLAMELFCEVVKQSAGNDVSNNALGSFLSANVEGGGNNNNGVGGASCLQQLLRGLMLCYLVDRDEEEWSSDPEKCVIRTDLRSEVDEDCDSAEILAEELVLSLLEFGGDLVLNATWGVIGDLIEESSSSTNNNEKYRRDCLVGALHAFGQGYKTMQNKKTDTYLPFLENKLLPTIQVDPNSGNNLNCHPLVARRVLWVIGMWVESISVQIDDERYILEMDDRMRGIRSVVINRLFDVLQCQKQQVGGIAVVIALQSLKTLGNFFSFMFEPKELQPSQYGAYMESVSAVLPQLVEPSTVQEVCDDVGCLISCAGNVFSEGQVAEETIRMFLPTLDKYVNRFRNLDGQRDQGQDHGGEEVDESDYPAEIPVGNAAGSVIATLTSTLYHSRASDAGRWELVPYAKYIVSPESILSAWASDKGWALAAAIPRSALNPHQNFTPELLTQVLTHIERDFEGYEDLVGTLSGITLLCPDILGNNSDGDILQQLASCALKAISHDDDLGDIAKNGFALLDLCLLLAFEQTAAISWNPIGTHIMDCNQEECRAFYHSALAARILLGASVNQLAGIYHDAFPSAEQQSKFLEILVTSLDDTESNYPRLLVYQLVKKLGETNQVQIPEDCQDMISDLLSNTDDLMLLLGGNNNSENEIKTQLLVEYASFACETLEYEDPNEGTGPRPANPHQLRLANLLFRHHHQ